MKKITLLSVIIIFSSCQPDAIENLDKKQTTISSSDIWILKSISQDGIDYTTECDKLNTLSFGVSSEINQVFFGNNKGDCSQISSISGSFNLSNNQFESIDKSMLGSIEISDNIIRLEYAEHLSGTIITYSK